METTLAEAIKMRKTGLEPYRMAIMKAPNCEHDRNVRIMSYPCPETDHYSIMVQMVPGDPNTSRQVDCTQLKKILPKRKRWYLHRAVIHGAMRFPEDMLRYDDCATVDPDLFIMETDEWGDPRPVRGSTLAGRAEVYRVTENSCRDYPPFTVARWQSFMWACEYVHTELITSDEPSGKPAL